MRVNRSGPDAGRGCGAKMRRKDGGQGWRAAMMGRLGCGEGWRAPPRDTWPVAAS